MYALSIDRVRHRLDIELDAGVLADCFNVGSTTVRDLHGNTSPFDSRRQRHKYRDCPRYVSDNPYINSSKPRYIRSLSRGSMTGVQRHSTQTIEEHSGLRASTMNQNKTLIVFEQTLYVACKKANRVMYMPNASR